ncbi:MAG: sodium-dependent transporter [Candidatus Delongbacteria bacterium]|nr:sodium-dependent transporter [Candidatus Delongbacteria bacterium]
MSRDRWSSRYIFLFAAIGSAVGLGNVWKFPYLAYKYGGGAFLIPYFIALIVIGIPLLTIEFALGQKMQSGAFDSFVKVHKRAGGIGFAAIFAGFIVVVYYAAVMAWSLLYFMRSFTNDLPWAADSGDYFFNNILKISSGVGDIGGVNWVLFIALFFVWVMIYFTIWKGVKSVGKVVAITMPLPIILLVILFIRGITLDGAGYGISAYLTPDFNILLDTDIWLAAISQIFFTLSIGFGIMIAYASYNKKDQNVLGDAVITAVVNSAISLFAGFVVFSVLGYMATSTSVDISEVAKSGPGLAFVVFPKALSLMPWAGFFSVLFFITLLTLGIDSAFSLVEAVNTSMKDRFPKLTLAKISFYTCTLAFLLGILFVTNAGLYYLDIVDHFITYYGLVIVGLFEVIIIGWVYKAKRMREFINSVSKFKLGVWFDILLKFIIPIILLLILADNLVNEFETNYEGYPDWALRIGWGLIVFQIVVALFLVLRKKYDNVSDTDQ